MRELEPALARDLRPALEARLRRLAGDPAAPAQLFWKEVGEARAIAPHELWAALAGALEAERIEVVLAVLPGGALVELDAAQVPLEAPAVVFTRDFKFLFAARPADRGVDATIGAPQRFLCRLDEVLPELERRAV